MSLTAVVVTWLQIFNNCTFFLQFIVGFMKLLPVKKQNKKHQNTFKSSIQKYCSGKRKTVPRDMTSDSILYIYELYLGLNNLFFNFTPL